MNKIKSLEGFRFLASIAVVLCHFRGAFFPGRQLWLIDKTPLRFLTSGDPAVRMLFMLSGFVLSYKYLILKKDHENIPSDMLKRYFRLAPPIIAAQLLVCFLMKKGLLFNIQAGALSGSTDFLSIFNNFVPTWSSCIKEGLISCYLSYSNAYIGPLWTIFYEYMGTLLVLAILYIFKNRRLRLIIYSVFLGFYNSYYNYFIWGMVLCEFYGEEKIRSFLRNHSVLNTLLCLSSFSVAGMMQIYDSVKVNRLIFAGATLMFFLSLMNSSWGEKILGNKVMEKGGGLSYCIYILHWPIIESFSSALYIWMYGRNGSVSTLLTMVNLGLTLVLTFLAAMFFKKYIEKMGQGAVDYISRHPVP